MSGSERSLSGPIAEIRNCASTGPAEVSMSQRCRVSSQSAPSTSCPKRTWSLTPNSSAQRRM